MPAVTRVAFVSYDDEPPLGGQGVELRGMRAALLARGHEVTTVAGRGEHAQAYPRVTHRAPLDFSLHVNRHPALLTGNHPDVVHALGGPGGVLLVRRLGVPVVYTANHTYRMAHAQGSPRRLLSPLEARAYRRAAMVLAISGSTAASVRELGVPRDRVEVLPPGVDVPAGDPRPRDQLRLMFAGRWEPEKGVLTAIATMAAVLSQTAGTGVVIGAGSLDAAVRRAAASVPAVEVAGRVDDARLAAEYGRASIVVVPSLYEGLGLVALEAQAHGAVVVGYDTEGLRDAVPDRALLAPRGDADALARLCLRVAHDAAERGDAAARARAWVTETHSWSRVAARLEEVYAAVTGG